MDNPGAPRSTAAAAGARLVLSLFGAFAMERDGRPLPQTRTRKERSLLALLALPHRASWDRATLAATLWPESTDAQALDNLRRSLYNLRQVLGEDAFRLVAPTPRTLRLELSGASCDLVAFDAAIARGDLSSLQKAVHLYRGPLLAECDDPWAFPERAVREQQYLAAMETLAASAREAGDTEAAIGWLRRIVTTDPLRESAQRALIEGLAGRGDVAAATLAYRQLRSRLHEVLQTEPALETTALYRSVRAAARLRPPVAVEVGRGGARPSLRNVPRPISALVGRIEEIAEAASRFAHARLVTLTGSGGIGKTRLSLAIADSVAAEFSGGIWFVDLAPLNDGAFVLQSVAGKLGVRGEPDRPLEETLTGFLASRHALLILDNCEHLLHPCAGLANRLLTACPDLYILATSRQSLGIVGESIFPVPPLPLPAGPLEADSTRLFVERAMDVSATFVPTRRNAAAIAQICRRLDGIPLAIELAAARVRALTVEQIDARLDDRFRLLTGGSAADLPRHQTLRGCTAWSYDLLTEPERTLFGRLSVFSGGWTLDAAEAVCVGNGVERQTVLDLLSALIDKSLVAVAGGDGGEARYAFLETIRQYAGERLTERGQAGDTALRHLDYFLGLAESAAVQLPGQEQMASFDRLEVEQDNLRVAFRTANESPSSNESALRLCGALRQFWELRGHALEGRDWCASALGKADTGARSRARADALNCAGALAAFQGEHAVGRALLEQALALYRERGIAGGIADSLTDLGNVAHELGENEAALAYYEDSLRLWREIGHRPGIATLLANLGLVARKRGDHAQARRYYEDSLAIRREIGDRAGIGASAHGLGLVAFRQGEYALARSLWEEALGLYRHVGDRAGIAWLSNDLGLVAYWEAEYRTARTYFAQSLTVFQEIGAPLGVAYCLEAFADLAAAESTVGGPERGADLLQATRLWGAAQRLRTELGTPLPAAEQDERERHLDAARSALGESAFRAALGAGRAMTTGQAADCALSR